MKKLAAEFIGTFWLVLGGCGSAVLAAHADPAPFGGIGILGVALAFGLTVLTMVYAIGHISGGHLNPAVSVATAIFMQVGAGAAVALLGGASVRRGARRHPLPAAHAG